MTSTPATKPLCFEVPIVDNNAILTSNGYIPVGGVRTGDLIAVAGDNFPGYNSISFVPLDHFEITPPTIDIFDVYKGPSHPTLFLPEGSVVYGMPTHFKKVSKPLLELYGEALRSLPRGEFWRHGNSNKLVPTPYFSMFRTTYKEEQSAELAQAFLLATLGTRREGSFDSYSFGAKEILRDIAKLYGGRNVFIDPAGATLFWSANARTSSCRTTGNFPLSYLKSVSEISAHTLRRCADMSLRFTLSSAAFCNLSLVGAGSGAVVMQKARRGKSLVADLNYKYLNASNLTRFQRVSAVTAKRHIKIKASSLRLTLTSPGTLILNNFNICQM
jgi:hypothetical protein